jgi:hypothetical protein
VCHHNCPDVSFASAATATFSSRRATPPKPDQLIALWVVGPGATIDPNDPFTIA